MKTNKWKKHTLSVLVMAIFMTVLSCFACGKTEEEMPNKEEAAISEENDVSLAEMEKQEEEDLQETEEEKLVFGGGDSSGKSLSEDVVLALKNGDTKSLIGVALGEKYDYDVFEAVGNGLYRPKELVFDWQVIYYFDGKGHRFSGFDAAGEEPFQGIEFGKDSAAMFVKAFGEPDICEKVESSSGRCYRAKGSWYFDKAVLTVEESEDNTVRSIEYRALGDAADGDDDEETKSEFELRMERRSESEKIEAVYGWEFAEYEKDVHYPAEGEEYDPDKADEFVKNYLEEQGFGGKSPDSIIYDGERQKLAECYIDNGKERYCFIIYDGGVCCAVRELQSAGEPEHIIYRCDETGNVVKEAQYDIWGMRKVVASYQYHDGIPLPFITGNWNLRYIVGSLGREYKTWFSEKNVELDHNGRVKAVTKVDDADWNYQCYLDFPCSFAYRTDGKLEMIQEEIPSEWFGEELEDDSIRYSGYMEFEYSKDGTLKKIDYSRSSQVYGTGDAGGFIDFDEQGRMVHNRFCMTHGHHSYFYFYHEEERRPWAILDWCGDIWSVTVYKPIVRAQYDLKF